MNIILLTATVLPNVTAFLTISDPVRRLRQYQDAMLAWSKALDDSTFVLAVVETSGATKDDVLKLLPMADKERAIFLNYLPTSRETAQGKGAIEMAALQFAISSIDGLHGDDTVYKCTGRLFVTNIDQCLKPLAQNTVRIRSSLDRSWVDTRFFGATVEVWRDQLFNSSKFVDDDAGRFFEHVVAAQLSAALALHTIHLNRFPRRPLFSGVSGSSGSNYSAGISRLRSWLFEGVERFLASLASKKQA